MAAWRPEGLEIMDLDAFTFDSVGQRPASASREPALMDRMEPEGQKTNEDEAAPAFISSRESAEPVMSHEVQLKRINEQIQTQEAAIRRLHTELILAQKSLRMMFGARNSLQRIRIIPDEILAYIFELLCDGDAYWDWANWGRAYIYNHKVPSSDATEPEFRQPIRLSHVCQHWRAVALATHSLWRNIPLHRLSVATPFLGRTREAQVNVSIRSMLEMSPKEGARMLKLLEKHGHRLRGLHFPPASSLEELVLCSEALKTASSLWRLANVRIEFPRDLPSELEDQPDLDHVLECIFPARTDSRLTSDIRPALKQVDVSYLPIPWNSPFLSGHLLRGQLTHFRVCAQRPPTLSTLLDVLRSNPCLVEILFEDLRLRQSFDLDSDLSFSSRTAARVDPANRVCLSHLRLLSLDTVDINYEALLAHIDTPACLRLLHSFPVGSGMDAERDESDTWEQPHGIDVLLTAPMKRLAHLMAFQGTNVREVVYRHSHRWRKCHITFLQECNLESEHGGGAASTLRRILETGESDTGTVQLHMTFTSAYEFAPLMFGSLGDPRAIPLPNLRILYLHGVPQYDPNDWHLCGFDAETYGVVFKRLGALEVLVVNGCDVWALLRGLTPVLHLELPPEEREQTSSIRQPCPRLCTLEIIMDHNMRNTEYGEQVPMIAQEEAELLLLCILGRAHLARDGSASLEAPSVQSLKTVRVSPIPSSIGATAVTNRNDTFVDPSAARLGWLNEQLDKVGVHGQLSRTRDEFKDTAEVWEWTF